MVKVFGHRGASGYAPENTLAAFRRAIEMGCDGVEFDVQLSNDDELVVIHDETLDRTTDGSGYVCQLTLDQLKGLDASAGMPGFAGERIPTFEEVLDLLAPSELEINVEIKDSVIPYAGLADKVLAMISQRHLERRVIVSTFNHNTLAHMRQSGSMLRTGILFQDVLYEPWNYAHQIWATALHPHWLYVDYVTNLVTESHNALLDINVWTVNEPEDIARMLGLGVDGIITDYPDRVLSRL
ncbi:MAG: glycerophosphodiester phosphodiesterase [Propionibacteriaceae bacterium]|jgi:glycerophosphoryl diester phosphodiesterase|nr:glycerophosphodiester phosphodiesterase [Propionibacteriaceae bacterium]